MTGRIVPVTLAAWVVTDGKAGDEAPCLGVVEALGLAPRTIRVRPRAPWSWLLPRGPLDPRERPGAATSPFRPPFPDLLVGSGRRAVAYLSAVKRASGGRTFTVCLKDPRIGAGAADLVWVPDYDRLRGESVVVTPTSPHRLGRARLAAALAAPDPRLDALPGPRAAVLVGGDSRGIRFSDEDINRLLADLDGLAAAGLSLMATTSRRTPPALSDALARRAAQGGLFVWDGTGPNPLAGMLARADQIVVTADSINMMSESVATGRPVLLFRPARLSWRQAALADALVRRGAARPLAGRPESFTYEPVDSTPVVAAAIEAALHRHRHLLGLV